MTRLLTRGIPSFYCAMVVNVSCALAQDAPRSAAAIAMPRELSPWNMFQSADIVVKVVMMALAVASLTTWTIFLAKSAELVVARRRLRAAVERATMADTIDSAIARSNGGLSPIGEMLDAAVRERALSADGMAVDGVKERAAATFSDIVKIETNAGRRGMSVLATVGSTAPFVGLFGTVWGIMNSFIGISRAQTTNLAVVAPGIAEALLATAIGLVAAIPAVIFYNHFSRVARGHQELLARGANVVLRLLSRDLDRDRAARGLS